MRFAPRHRTANHVNHVVDVIDDFGAFNEGFPNDKHASSRLGSRSSYKDRTSARPRSSNQNTRGLCLTSMMSACQKISLPWTETVARGSLATSVVTPSLKGRFWLFIKNAEF